MIREKTIRIETLSRVLQRAEYIEEDEEVIDLEFDEMIRLVTLYIEGKEGRK